MGVPGGRKIEEEAGPLVPGLTEIEEYRPEGGGREAPEAPAIPTPGDSVFTLALGFGVDDLIKMRPGIVYANISAYGFGGPWKHRRGVSPNPPIVLI